MDRKTARIGLGIAGSTAWGGAGRPVQLSLKQRLALAFGAACWLNYVGESKFPAEGGGAPKARKRAPKAAVAAQPTM